MIKQVSAAVMGLQVSSEPGWADYLTGLATGVYLAQLDYEVSEVYAASACAALGDWGSEAGIVNLEAVRETAMALIQIARSE